MSGAKHFVYCSRAGIAAVGAGRNAAEAQRPAIVRLGGGEAAGPLSRVLVWAVGHESSGVPDEWEAGPHQPGVFVTDLSAGDVARLGELVGGASSARWARILWAMSFLQDR